MFWSLTAFLISFIIQVNLVVPAFLIALCVYLSLRKMHLRNCRFLNLVFLFLIIFVSSYFILQEKWPLFIIPFSVAPMIATLVFNDIVVAFLLTVAISFSVASLSANPFAVVAFFLISGTISSILVQDARKRSTIIRAGVIIGITQVATLIFLEHLWIGLANRYLIFFVNGIVSSIVVLGVLPIFEFLFKTVTNISLLELADSNHPLLQRMVLEAPGTYHHSLMVGNLSDAACKAVGANSLLARIGAYYHDIGKIEKASYFSENQSVLGSKHETLTADMSKLIIMNHVKEGVELAKKHRLNPAIIDFIQEHHGRSLVYYFYRRAIESIEEDREIAEDGFRYPGPKPKTKETAIVLLADSVEAAVRALREPAAAQIEEVVHKIINNKFIDGQLDECDLTLKDLEKISAVFIRILGGIYHSRISYPEEKTRENNHKKPAKEDSHQSVKDKKSNT